MAKNLVYKDGEQLKFYTNSSPGSEIESGEPFVVGQIPAVAMADEENGYTVGRLVGVFELSVTGTVSAVGTPIYITSANALTTTAGSNVLFGYALETKSSGTGVIKVLLARS